jgi:hypothetical protein
MLATLALLLALFQAVERPRPDWVFRAELDGRPQSVIVALSRELWVAYDSRACSLARVWRGGVGLRDGAPGLASQGEALSVGGEGQVWWLESNGRALATSVVWRGYRFSGGEVALRYELVAEGARVTIEETPEFVRPRDVCEDPASAAPWMRADLIGLRRRFKASGIPEGMRAVLTLRTRCVGYLAYDRILDPIERAVEGQTERELLARLPLDQGNSTSEIHVFFAAAAERLK